MEWVALTQDIYRYDYNKLSFADKFMGVNVLDPGKCEKK